MGSDPTGMGQIESRLGTAIRGRRGLTPAPPVPDTYGRYDWRRAFTHVAGDGDAPPVAITFEWASALPEAASAATTVTEAALADESSDTAILAWDSSC